MLSIKTKADTLNREEKVTQFLLTYDGVLVSLFLFLFLSE